MKTELHITPDGTLHAVADETAERIAESLGGVSKRRASHVVPCHPWKRFAFRTLRRVFTERGHVASWCRSWRGPWEVRFADNPHVVAFTHPSRRVCIEWEIQRLNERLAV